MKATGVVRNVDGLGRITLPKEIRRTLRISEGDPVEFYVDGDGFFVRKYDAVGDMEQLLEKFEKSIKTGDTLISPFQMRKLLGKVEEMKIILSKGG